MPRNKQISEQMRTQTREKILSTARKLFAKQGYFNCKISDIAQEAGMSQGILYWYFSSKEELLKSVLSDGFETLGQLTESAANRSGTSREKLDALLDDYIAFGRQKGEFTAVFISILGHGGMPLLMKLGFNTTQIGMRYHQALSTILAQGQAEGTVLPEIDPNILTMFFFSLFNGLMITYGTDWLNVPEQFVRQAVLRLLGSQITTSVE
jgi:AcrR family transcriptional regulator